MALCRPSGSALHIFPEYERQLIQFAERRLPMPPLYTIFTARPWPVRNSGQKKSAMLLMLPGVYLALKHQLNIVEYTLE
jgi:hypothetical protein